MRIKEFLIKLYRVIFDFILFNSGSKVKWGNKIEIMDENKHLLTMKWGLKNKY